MSNLRTREEEIWWKAPQLHYLRNLICESVIRDTDWCEPGEYAFRNHVAYNWNTLSPVGGKMPILLLSSSGWSVMHFSRLSIFRLKEYWRWGVSLLDRKPFMNNRAQTDDYITGPNDSTLTALDRLVYVSRDPRLLNEADFREEDESRKAYRLLCEATTRLTATEPEIASLWRDGQQLMVGWNPLPKPDGRKVSPVYPYLPSKSWMGVPYSELHQWRWRAKRTDIDYAGMKAETD